MPVITIIIIIIPSVGDRKGIQPIIPKILLQQTYWRPSLTWSNLQKNRPVKL